MDFENFINKNFVYAVIGVSLNPQKFGNRVFTYLKGEGYNVLGINPKGGEVMGEKLYKSIDEIEKDVDVVVFVIPPQIAQSVLKEVVNKGIKKVWFQPGSESSQLKKICENSDIEFVMEDCIMIENEKQKNS